MSRNEHTPGPWRFTGDEPGATTNSLMADDGQLVLWSDGVRLRAKEVDERLIAKSPEMYRLLRDIVTNDDAIQQAMRTSALGRPADWQHNRTRWLRDKARSLVEEVKG